MKSMTTLILLFVSFSIPQSLFAAENYDSALKIIENYSDNKLEKIMKNAKGIIAESDHNKNKPEIPWATLDPKKNGVEGTSTEIAYKEFKLRHLFGRLKKDVVVAVIDSGVDIHHEDLKEKIWTNKEEEKGLPGVDDDGNGYIDDVHGWNFLGSKDGKNIKSSTLEVTREYVKYKKKKETSGLTPEEEIYFEKVRTDYLTSKNDNFMNLLNFKELQVRMNRAIEVLKAAGLKEETLVAVQAIQSADPEVLKAKEFAVSMLSKKRPLTTARLNTLVERFQSGEDYYYNTQFDSSTIVGDDPNNLKEIGYGNPDVVAVKDAHGTHVSGIIAAQRKNDLGIYGQARHVKIMPIRAVPDGDERDKDVANAVRYAVDNGADIINMSFGKAYSPNKNIVDEAFEYADSKNVLVIHAAGNDNLNLDSPENMHFPNREVRKSRGGMTKILQNWIEVGASAAKKDETLAASFTNYGKDKVDLFAPGVNVLSCVPDNQYAEFSGTSMATPEIAGIAALMLTMKNNLIPQEIRNILMKTSRQYLGHLVMTPGSDSEKILFSDLSSSGGIADAGAAIKEAL